MIILKKSFSNWIQVGENENGTPAEVYIEYPDLKAQQELDKLKYDCFSMGDEDPKMDGGKWINYIRHFVKFHIKDWRGIGEDFVKDKSGYMTDELLMALTRDEKQLSEIYQRIQTEVSFDATDKKK